MGSGFRRRIVCYCTALARLEGLLVGGSSGTAVAAALRYAQRLGPTDLVVVMCPDTGRNYLSKQFDDQWLRLHGLVKPQRPRLTLGGLLSAAGPRKLLYVAPHSPVQKP